MSSRDFFKNTVQGSQVFIVHLLAKVLCRGLVTERPGRSKVADAGATGQFKRPIDDLAIDSFQGRVGNGARIFAANVAQNFAGQVMMRCVPNGRWFGPL